MRTISVSLSTTHLKDLMSSGEKFPESDAISIAGSNAIVYYYNGYTPPPPGWYLRIHLDKASRVTGYGERDILLDPEQDPDRVVARILENAPSWCVELASFHPAHPGRTPLRGLMQSGQKFDWHNRIVITSGGIGIASFFYRPSEGWILAIPGRPYDPHTGTGGGEWQVPILKLDPTGKNPEKTVADALAAAGLFGL